MKDDFNFSSEDAEEKNDAKEHEESVRETFDKIFPNAHVDSDLNREKQNSKNKFHKMSLGEKIGYIWYYKKVYIIIAAILIIGIGGKLTYDNYMHSHRLMSVYACISIAIQDRQLANFTEEVEASLDSHNRIYAYGDFTINESEYENDSEQRQEIDKLISKGDCDVVIYSPSKAGSILDIDRDGCLLMDLREILSDAELEKVKKYLDYNVVNGEEIPVGIGCTPAKYVYEKSMLPSGAVIGIMKDAACKDNAATFLHYLISNID